MTDPGPLNALFVPAAPKGETPKKPVRKPPEPNPPLGQPVRKSPAQAIREAYDAAPEPAPPKTRKRRQNKPLDDIVVLKRCLKLLKSLPPADAKRIVQTLHLLFEL